MRYRGAMSIPPNSKSPIRPNTQGMTEDDREPGDAPPALPKYRRILEDLREAIESGELRPGDKVKTESELGRI